MKFTKEEIALARRLHELGVRKDIKYGDWYWDQYLTTIDKARVWDDRNSKVEESLSMLPLWQIHDCLEWLRDKRYKQGDLHWDENLIGKQVSNVYVETSDNRGMFVKDKFKHAKTPLEALLKAMVAIVKENKEEKE